MVDEIINAFKEHNPKLNVIKIWIKGNLNIVLAVYDKARWRVEMDPYYIYDGGRIDGIFLAQEQDLIDKILIDENLAYIDTSLT